MLDLDNFVEVGQNGIGNSRSLVAQSMSYFRDQLYLGVTHPTGESPEDAARILRFDPASAEWQVAYESPLVEADENAIVKDVYRGENSRTLGNLGEQGMVPLYRGFRCMAQFEPKDGGDPVLFASTLSHWGSQLLASEDGDNFEVASEPGLGDPDVLSFRTMLGFDNKLFVAPVGTVKSGVMDRNFGDLARLYVSEDPLANDWAEAIPPGFDDPTNRSVFCMAAMGEYLYAGTGNPDRGFELWKARPRGKPPYQWTRVLTRGAHRYNVNETTASMAVLNGMLYVGSGLPGLGYDKAHDVGPAAAELIRVAPDDSWELLVGASRFTPDGLKVPLSLMGPGYEDHENSALWAMTAYDGALYVGTHHCEAFHTALGGAERVTGGFQLWSSEDGENWNAVTMDGFDDPFSTGVRTLLPTPVGLFLGTSTHREIQRLWTMRTGRPIQRHGTGLSVWLGR